MKICVACSLDESVVKFANKAKRCNRCYVKAKAVRDAEFRSRGLCPCGVTLAKDRQLCARHLERGASYSKVTQRRHINAGLCPCGKPKDGSRKYCRQCLDAAWARTGPRNKAMKQRAVAFLGGHCADCGFESTEFPEAFDFHHQDPSVKVDKVSSFISRGVSWDTLVTELKKCILLCANCHRIRHAKEALAVPEIAELISA